MTVRIDCNQQQVHLRIEGDIYEEHAECLCDMVNSHVRRGMEKLDIELYATYYISRKGEEYLRGLKDMLIGKGVQVSIISKSRMNWTHDSVMV